MMRSVLLVCLASSLAVLVHCQVDGFERQVYRVPFELNSRCNECRVSSSECKFPNIPEQIGKLFDWDNYRVSSTRMSLCSRDTGMKSTIH